MSRFHWPGRPTLNPLSTLATILAFVLMWLSVPVHAESREPIASGSLLVGPIHFELAIYYPSTPARSPMTALRARLAALPKGPQLVTAVPKTAPTNDLVLAIWTTSAQQDYRPPNEAMVQRFGHGLTREQGLAIQRAESALIVEFVHPAEHAAPALKNALLLLEQVARDTDGLLWDDETREVFTPDAWHKQRLESWVGDLPQASRHTVIHAYKADKLVRAITLGMAKFGLPDIVVNDFSWSLNRPVGNLINTFSQALVEGATLREAGAFDLRLDAIRHAAAREAQTSTLKANATATARLSLVKGKWEDGDPRNRLIEVTFDRYPGPDVYARQEAMLAGLFGAEDTVSSVRHTNELEAASNAAKAGLPALRDTFKRGLAPGEYIMLKAPFAITGGGQEWMWVEVLGWDGDSITGLLKNEPSQIPTLHAGQTVKVSQSKVFDYLHRYPDGREEGNETSAIIKRLEESRRR